MKKLFMVLLLCTLFISISKVTHAVDVDFSRSRSLPSFSNDRVLFENLIVGNERIAAVMRWNSSSKVLEPIWFGTLIKVEIPLRTIIIDGSDGDWSGIPPIVTDIPGDEDPLYSGVTGTDLSAVYMTHDDTYLYFRMTFHDGDPIGDAMYVVEFQQYLTQLHTPGDRFSVASNVSGIWTASTHDRIGSGIGSEIVTSYPSDYASGGTGMVEWKVKIVDVEWPPDTPHPYFPPFPLGQQGIGNRFIRAYIHPGPHPNSPPVSDANDELTRPIVVNFEIN